MTAASSGLSRRRRARLVAFGLGVVALGFVLSLVIGMPNVSLTNALGDAQSWERKVLVVLQLPRVVEGLAVGAVLGVAGAALQGLLRNPLADPFILGVSGGAALGSAAASLVASAVGLVVPFVLAPVGGFVGALGALVVVMALGSERGVPSPLRMLLVGVVVNSLAGALLMVLAALGDATAVQRTLVRLMGMLGADPQAPWLLWVTVAAAVVALAVVVPRARALDVLALGDETAQSLGVAPERLRRRLFVWLSIPVGAVVSVAGLIGFAGLVVPHAVRLAVGPDHRALVPLSACFGAAFVAVADAVTSRIAPGVGNEMPVGVATALVGGPVFLILLRTKLREAPT